MPEQTGASSPAALHAILADAFNRGDLDGYANSYDEEAILIVPPDRRAACGRAAIRADAAAMLGRRPRLAIEVDSVLEADGLALSRTRWTLGLTDPDGNPVELSGRAAVVSRRRPDGSWGVVLDDPMSCA